MSDFDRQLEQQITEHLQKEQDMKKEPWPRKYIDKAVDAAKTTLGIAGAAAALPANVRSTTRLYKIND